MVSWRACVCECMCVCVLCVSPGICFGEFSLLRDQVTITVRDICLQGHLSCCTYVPTQKGLECGDPGNLGF